MHDDYSHMELGQAFDHTLKVPNSLSAFYICFWETIRAQIEKYWHNRERDA